MTHDPPAQPTRRLQWDPYANSFARASEKVELVLCWLAKFHYSTRRVLAEMLTVDPEGQRGFFKRLERHGLVRTFQMPTIREALVLLTPNGLEHARALTPDAVSYNTEPSKITSSTVVHTLSVQLAAMRMQRDVHKITSERNLDFAERVKLPDAVIEIEHGDGAEKVALEVELTHKSTARIYRALIDSIQNIKEGHYSRVRYVFNKNVLLDYYQRRFLEPRWPYYDRDPRTHRLFHAKRDNEPFYIDSTDARIKAMFEFSRQDLYS